MMAGRFANIVNRVRNDNNKSTSRLRSVVTADGLLREYNSERHGRLLLDGIGDVFLARQFTDVVVKIGETEIKAHKCILSACSKYFRAMFTTDLKEGQTDVVELKNMKEDSVNKVVNFMYTGKIQIVTDGVEDLLKVADMFDIQEVRDACTDTLIRNLCPDNCINMANLASAHNLAALTKAALKYAHENVETVLQSQEFLKSSIAQVKALLSSDELNVKSELTVFDGVLRWIKHDKGPRQQYIEELFGLIRLSIIPVADLIERVSNEDVINTNSKCRDMLNKAMEEYHQSLKNPSTRKASRIGAKAGHLFCLGGEGAESRVEVYHSNVNRWERGKVDMLVGRSGAMAVAHSGKLIFIIGGQDKRKRPLNSVDVYDIRMKNWKSLSSMYEQRVYGAATIIEGNIYVAGGAFDRTVLMSAEFYNIENDIWNRMAALTQPRSRCGCATVDGHMYVVGGHDGIRDLDSISRYSPETDSWTDLKPMRYGRNGCAVGAVESHIFAVGGCRSDGTVLYSIERYNTETDQWSSVGLMQSGRFALAVAVVSGQLFIIGGNDGKGSVNVVEKFNPVKNKSELVTPMKRPREWMAVAVT
ncbi:kelch-like protein 20 isoform X3 [Bolinopsis microptera]|uniref:kelch-like protein 20 isoform X3 n=1 Tax=Bolinopsis microptera TaxID=2820187 RepID=UPI0030794F73